MKKTIMMVMVALAITTSAQAIEVLKGQDKPVGCQQLAEIRVGDLFSRHAKDIAQQGVIAEAAKINAHKVSVQLIAHQHPKLGRDYTAVGTAWKCGG